ncbi:MAG: hydroxymethylbilane synthase [Thaumarchaeota archaeon]|nr:hydroxymethylbilane synthase [Nitrososphaerota archaeon]
MKFKVGTRGSKLSIVQTQLVLDILNKVQDDIEFEIVTIKTKGDTDARPLYTIDRNGIFEKEIDAAVQYGKVDFAVHSLKDIPSFLPEDLTIASIPRRESPYDVFVNNKRLKLKDITSDSIIGTSSLRRAIQIRRVRGDVIIRPIRGNIETRVNKMMNKEFDAVVLAESGLKRLGMEDIIVERLSIDDFMPSPGQGAIAIVSRDDDHELIKILKKIDYEKSRAEITAERALLFRMNAGCRFPLGALGSVNGSKLELYANVYSVDGTEMIDVRKSGRIDNAENLGISVANELEEKGSMKLSLLWRDAVDKWSVNK